MMRNTFYKNQDIVKDLKNEIQSEQRKHNTTRPFPLNRPKFQNTSKPFDVTASERDSKNKTPTVVNHASPQKLCEKFQFCEFIDSLPDLEELESKLNAYYALEKESKRTKWGLETTEYRNVNGRGSHVLFKDKVSAEKQLSPFNWMHALSFNFLFPKYHHHQINWKEASIIQKEQNFGKRKLKESACIQLNGGVFPNNVFPVKSYSTTNKL
ncbi:hypothetical protein NQ315_012971 [Exocentrus adspersus]|uniref:Uncharacterized protein n=1 Tax=Exocentrus adspersus TaxID=1586481 RepID=A0AAV8VSQ1_9CUCU|nr:hypothetical protein NQ315_012971 [Exocentrus adspersus]